MKSVEIQEGKLKLCVPDPSKYKLDSSMPVFYNSVMHLNRDLSVLVLQAEERKMQCIDLLAATGIRGLRIKKEVPGSDVTLNDLNPQAYKLIQKNAKKNRLKVRVEKMPANVLLAERKPYDYIDIDPFGTPLPFLDLGIKKLRPKAILAVTATDTAALCGTYPKATRRKYGAKPLRNELMHEIGIRILIRKVQELGAQYELALTPVFCHSSNHYMRIYLRRESGANKTDAVLDQHGNFEGAGPMWLGKLWDEKTVKNMLKFDTSKEARALLETIAKEVEIPVVGFFDIHAEAKKLRLKQVPKQQSVFEKLRKKGYKAARTHFSLTGIRTDAKKAVFDRILRQ